MLCLGVFLSESLLVDVPLAVAQHRLLAFLHVGDLDSVVADAFGEGATVLAKAGVGGLGKMVTVKSIPPYQRGAVTVVPIRWLATGPLSGAFPVLDANLEMAAAGSKTTVTIIGSYRPPLGKVGEAVDSLVLNSVAQSTVRRFLGQLAEVAIHTAAAPSEQQPQIGFLEPE